MRKWKVFVTGSAGFVGRYMVEELEQRGCEVYTCDVKFGDDLLEILPQLDNIRFDLVVHLAYHVGGRQAIDGSPMNLAANTMLDAALFDWALRTRQKRVLYFSSSAAYPIVKQNGLYPVRLREEMIEYGDAQEPDANYGWAKLTGERMALAAIASNLRVYIVRPFSGYAEDQALDYPFPSLVKRARERTTPFEIWGSQEQVRDWIHITDVVRGSLAVVKNDVDEPVNLCTGVGVSMGELANMMGREIGFTPSIKVLKDMPMGVHYRVGDPSRFLSIYKPRVDIEWGVKRAMRWVAPAARPHP